VRIGGLPAQLSCSGAKHWPAQRGSPDRQRARGEDQP
jgi:hypothetical protein